MDEYKEYEFNNNYGIKVLVVLNKYGDGMQFKYSNVNHCFSMSIVGDLTASEAKGLIERYANK